MTRLWVVVCAVAGCFDTHLADEVPCAANGACPGQQICDLSRSPPRCVNELADAGALDAPDLDPDRIDAFTPLARWSEPTPLLIASASDDDPTLTGDMLELYFNRADDIYVTRRASLAQPWAVPVVVVELSTAATESTPEISRDGLTLYFSTNRTGSASTDIWFATRPSRSAPWNPPMTVPELNSPAIDRCAAPTGDALVMASTRAGSVDLFESRRSTLATWSTPSTLASLNTTAQDSAPFLSDDYLTLYFFSDRSGDSDLYVARRPDRNAAFASPERIGELSTTADESDPWVSPDGKHMVFTRGDVLYESVR